jgi:uncharacterized protein (DUF433 family)
MENGKWKTDLITAFGHQETPSGLPTTGHAVHDSPLAYYPPRRGTLEISMQKLDRITIDPAKMNGEPCIRGLRLTVRRVLEALATYPDREELKREYPELQDEDIRQAVIWGSDRAKFGDPETKYSNK